MKKISQIRHEFVSKIIIKVIDQTANEVRDQINGEIWRVHHQIQEQVWNQVDDNVWDQASFFRITNK